MEDPNLQKNRKIQGPASACCGESAFTRVLDARWHAPRVFRRAPERLSALRPPLDSGERSNDAKPRAQTCGAGTRRSGLFDMVRRSGTAAHFGEANPTNPTRVVPARGTPRRQKCVYARLRRAMRRGGPVAGIHNHGLWLWVAALRPLRWRRPGRRSFMRTTQQPVAVGNDRRLRSIVSGLLFTMDGATPTCRAVGCAPPRTVGRCRMGRGSKWWLGAGEEAGAAKPARRQRRDSPLIAAKR